MRSMKSIPVETGSGAAYARCSKMSPLSYVTLTNFQSTKKESDQEK